MNTSSVVIDGSFTVENVGNLQQKMREVLSRHNGTDGIQVDLGSVTEFDGAGLQLLLAFSRAVEKMGAKVELNSVPENIDAVLTAYNLKSRFANGELS